VNPSKSKFFGAVAYLKTGLVEFSHPLDQHCQLRCHFRFSLLIFNLQREQMLVHPMGEDVHINKKPLSGGAFLAAPKGGVQVFLPMVAMQR
jgi:hypothetical protein